MTIRSSILALLMGLGIVFSTTWAAKEPVDAGKVSRFVAQLGSLKFSERRSASRELDAIGPAALDELHKALASGDMETRRRAADLIARIEKRMEAAAVLAPTRVHLVCKDMGVTEAVAELAKKAKVNLQLHPSSVASLARKKITLDTRDVTFWEALDKLCVKAGLAETTMAGALNNIYNERIFDVIVAPNMPQGILPIQPQPNIRIKAIQLQRFIPVQPALKPAMGPIQIAIGSDAIYMPNQDSGQIVLAEGKPETAPTCYAGAFRIRARMAAGKDIRSDYVIFEVTPEPRHLGWSLVGNPRLEKATDDRGQALTLFLEEHMPNANFGQWGGNGRMAAMEWATSTYTAGPTLKRTVQIQIKRGAQPARSIKEIAGRITVQTKTAPEDLIVVSDILNATGRIAKGARSGSIRVHEVGKDKNGNHQIRFKLDKPSNLEESAAAFGNVVVGQGQLNINNIRGMVFHGGPSDVSNLSLRDAKGAPFQIISSSIQINNGEVTQTLTFQAKQGRQPAKLVFSGQRTVNVDVPFAFKGVNLP